MVFTIKYRVFCKFSNQIYYGSYMLDIWLILDGNIIVIFMVNITIMVNIEW